MGDTENLPVASEQTQFIADDFGDAAADTAIDFIEDQAGYLRGFTHDDLDGEADSR